MILKSEIKRLIRFFFPRLKTKNIGDFGRRLKFKGFFKPKIHSDDIILISVIKNESLRIPFFLKHYRSLGVKKFFFIDNISTDLSLKTLSELNAGDVFIYTAKGHYGHSRCGQDWIDQLLKLYGIGRWCLVADADELFIYPGYEKLPLSALSKYLEDGGFNYVPGMLLDMYSDKPIAETHYTAGQNPLDVCPYFDAQKPDYLDTYIDSLTGDRYDRVSGGMRKRVFGVSPCLTKNVFFKFHSAMVIRPGCHTIEGAKRADVEGAVLHFKYFQDFAPKVFEISKTGNQWADGLEYKGYAKALSEKGEKTAYHEHSIKYHSSSQLVELGFMKSSGKYESFLKKKNEF